MHPLLSTSCHPLVVVAAALLQFSTGVHSVGGGSTTPPFPSSSNASVNFSAATAAASFIGVDSLIFIGCDVFDDQSAADRACVGLLGHTRGQCGPFPAYGNATSIAVCKCITYAGLTPPGNCVDASCVWGTDACSVRQWQNYVVIILDVFTLLLATYIFGFGLNVIIVGRKNLKMNSMTVTLLSSTLASLFSVLWRLSEFLGYGVLLSTVLVTEIQKPVIIPLQVLCGLIGILAFPLQWLEVAKKTAQIKATRRDSSKAPYIAVTVTAFATAAALLFFTITGRSFLIGGKFLLFPCV